MKKDKLETYLSSFNGSEGSYPFGPEALVFKVMGKMFALASQNEEPPKVTLKCAPADGEVLVDEFDSVVPGYYMNKKHWITIALSGELPDEMLVKLIASSYRLVVGKLTRAEKEQLKDKAGAESNSH
jgi:predicted DNA-binding protein (MmcQ/YjbR family)